MLLPHGSPSRRNVVPQSLILTRAALAMNLPTFLSFLSNLYPRSCPLLHLLPRYWDIHRRNAEFRGGGGESERMGDGVVNQDIAPCSSRHFGRMMSQLHPLVLDSWPSFAYPSSGPSCDPARRTTQDPASRLHIHPRIPEAQDPWGFDSWPYSRRLFSRGTELWTGGMEKSCLLPNKNLGVKVRRE